MSAYISELLYLTFTTLVMYNTIPHNDEVRIDHPALRKIAIHWKKQALITSLPNEFDSGIINGIIIGFDPEFVISRTMIWVFYIQLWLQNFNLPLSLIATGGFVILILLPFLYIGTPCIYISFTIITSFLLLNLQRCWSVAGDPFLALFPTLGWWLFWSYFLHLKSANEYSDTYFLFWGFAVFHPFCLGFIIFRFI